MWSVHRASPCEWEPQPFFLEHAAWMCLSGENELFNWKYLSVFCTLRFAQHFNFFGTAVVICGVFIHSFLYFYCTGDDPLKFCNVNEAAGFSQSSLLPSLINKVHCSSHSCSVYSFCGDILLSAAQICCNENRFTIRIEHSVKLPFSAFTPAVFGYEDVLFSVD